MRQYDGMLLYCYRQSHQQLPSSHATDRVAEVATRVVRSDGVRAEEQDVSVVRRVRGR